MIIQLPKISAIYYGLLQSGYNFYTPERSAEHIRHIETYKSLEHSDVFFFGAKQDTCEVYPYWPRAFILELASFFLSDSITNFLDFDMLQRKILSAGNISARERDESLWNWLDSFPQAIASVFSDSSFTRYLEWEKEWIIKQGIIHQEEIYLICECLETCISRYHSTVQEIQICLNPIKCVYSSDYHLTTDCFIFSSGAFRTDSIIHEFLHHVVHPYVDERGALILGDKPVNKQLDESYYLAGTDSEIINAFEETVVRYISLTVFLTFQSDV